VQKLVRSERSMADIDLQDRQTVYQGWSKVETFQVRHRKFDGDWSPVLKREVHYVGEAACILPWDPATGQVVLIEQFRASGLVHGEATWLIEAIAGLVEQGQSPEATARREAKEEAACKVERLIPVLSAFSSPGSSGERSHLFVGITKLDGVGGIHGLDNEDEDIRAFTVPLNEALSACHDGRIADLKTIALIQWLTLNEDKLR